MWSRRLADVLEVIIQHSDSFMSAETMYYGLSDLNEDFVLIQPLTQIPHNSPDSQAGNHSDSYFSTP
jgi:hypothetical protein